MKRFIVILVACLPVFSQMRAQQVVASAGDFAKASGFSLAWTLGEPVIGTFTGTSSILTQGFHQTRLGTTAVNDIPLPGISLTVYPNPLEDVLHLRVEGVDHESLRYALYNLQGQGLAAGQTAATLTDINLRLFPAGNYLLQVRGKSGEIIRSFKVIKYR
jgi:hypothetical protein